MNREEAIAHLDKRLPYGKDKWRRQRLFGLLDRVDPAAVIAMWEELRDKAVGDWCTYYPPAAHLVTALEAVDDHVGKALCRCETCHFCMARHEDEYRQRCAEARRIPAATRRHLLGQPCAYCGDPAEEIDHVLPVCRGGTNDPSNLAPACYECNRRKSTMTAKEWADCFEEALVQVIDSAEVDA